MSRDEDYSRILREEVAALGAPPELVPVLDGVRRAESNNDPLAQSPTSSAAGLYQITSATWSDYGEGNILDPRNNTRGIIRVASAHYESMRELLGRAPTPGESYLALFAGGGGARSVLRAEPDARLDSGILSDGAIAANASITYVRDDGTPVSFANFTAGDLRGWAEHKMEERMDDHRAYADSRAARDETTDDPAEIERRRLEDKDEVARRRETLLYYGADEKKIEGISDDQMLGDFFFALIEALISMFAPPERDQSQMAEAGETPSQTVPRAGQTDEPVRGA